MSLTVDVAEGSNVRLSHEDVVAVAPDSLEFAVEGRVTVTAETLASFEGASLHPVAVTLTGEDAPVVVELDDGAELRLDSVDVGVETPDADDFARGADGLEAAATDVTDDVDAEGIDAEGIDAEGIDTDAGVLAFAVEGTITGVSPEAFEALSEASPSIESITFDVDGQVAADGGPADDAIFEFALLGYAVVVRRDGSITVGRR